MDNEKVYIVYINGRTINEIGNVYITREAAEENCKEIMRHIPSACNVHAFFIEREIIV
jgi:hypothetical protein